MNDFVFYSPTEFHFGRTATDGMGKALSEAGFKCALVVYGQGSVKRSGVLDQVKRSLAEAGVDLIELGGARPNPEVGFVRKGIELVRAHGLDSVVAVGGGSVIDAAKAIAFGVFYEGDVWDIFSQRLPIERALPIAALVTIPAAGSEASASCVISNDAEGRKVGVESDAFRPRFAFMNPEHTFSLPAYQTAAGVTDMFAHICERYFSGLGTVTVTDGIATSLLRTLIEHGPRAIEHPEDYEARANIMWVGMLAHNDIAGCGRALNPGGRAGGWESHGLEHEVSAHFVDVTHGAGLAVIMPNWMRYVWSADPSRFLSYARDVFGIEPVDDTAIAIRDAVEAAIDETQEFFMSLGMPSSLREFGIDRSDIETFITTLEKTKGERFGSFRPLDMEDSRAIYRMSLEPHEPNVWETEEEREAQAG